MFTFLINLQIFLNNSFSDIKVTLKKLRHQINYIVFATKIKCIFPLMMV